MALSLSMKGYATPVKRPIALIDDELSEAYANNRVNA